MTTKHQIDQLVAEKKASGMSHEQALRAVFKENPELREQLVDEANAHNPNYVARRPAG